jgi:hypothetical protein
VAIPTVPTPTAVVEATMTKRATPAAETVSETASIAKRVPPAVRDRVVKPGGSIARKSATAK